MTTNTNSVAWDELASRTISAEQTIALRYGEGSVSQEDVDRVRSAIDAWRGTHPITSAPHIERDMLAVLDSYGL